MEYADPQWRERWQIDESDLADCHALHVCGLGFKFVYTEVSDDGDMGWVTTMPPWSAAISDSMFAQMGPEPHEWFLSVLRSQALDLWHDLGYSDEAPVALGR